MITIANNAFDKFEEKQKQNKDKIKSINLTEMMVEFTSSVVLTGFVGLDTVQ